MSLLKYVLTSWFLDVSFEIICLSRIIILEANAVTSGAKTCHLACLVPPLWHPGDHGTIQGRLGAHERTPWGPGLDFIDFGWIAGTHFQSFLDTSAQNTCFVHACFQVIAF